MVEGMKVADGSNWFKGLANKISVDTLSSLIPPPPKLNLIILTQKLSSNTHTQHCLEPIHSHLFDVVKVALPVCVTYCESIN